MCITFHPKLPSVIAGGSFNGNPLMCLIVLLQDNHITSHNIYTVSDTPFNGDFR